MAQGLRRRLDRLEPKDSEPWHIEVWLHDLDGKTATGPDGTRYTALEAERLQESADLLLSLPDREHSVKKLSQKPLLGGAKRGLDEQSE